MRPLPIDALLDDIVRTVSAAGALALEAPPGAGKTTRVPAALMRAQPSMVIVAEPRRLAARLAAHRVADELGQRPGQTVGYAVRFEQVSGPSTKLHYVTEGVLLRRLLADPALEGVSTVVLDEFHERHLATDLLLALLERLRRTARRDLRLVVMSATLDAVAVARFLACPRIASEGRSFPVDIEHLERPDDRPLEKQIASAVKRLLREDSGDTLVFVPGAAEIRRAQEQLAAAAAEANALVLPLHGDLPLAEQARAIEVASQRKVILATNVAESSITVEGVTAVVDSGLARAAAHSPWSGLPTLNVVKVSRASAIQRAGRAGRVRPGRVLRLYTRGDFETRPEHERPEIARLDLAEALLMLHGAGVARIDEVAWLSAPPEAAMTAAEALLRRFKAVDEGGSLTPLGRRMLAFPLPPRLARLVVEGERLGVARDAALAAALLSERDIRLAARSSFGRDGRKDADVATGPSDVAELMERFREAEEARFDSQRLHYLELDRRTVLAVSEARRRIEDIAQDVADRPRGMAAVDEAVQRAVLAAYSDRIARRREPGSRDLILASGTRAELSEASVVRSAPFVVALDAEERGGRSRQVVVRLASAIEPDWLLESYPDLVEWSESLVWNEKSEQVDSVSRIAVGSVILDEERRAATPSAEATALLCRAARDAGFDRDERLASLLRRIELARETMPEFRDSVVEADAVASALERVCTGLTSFAELREHNLAEALLSSFSPAQRALLEAELPERLALPGGRNVRVEYESGKPPWIASRLQDFFGMSRTPTLLRGRLPLTVHLLAPNQRAVQVTQDLAGFWERHYPTIRRELCRRYPRHAWPEDGGTATPAAPKKR